MTNPIQKQSRLNPVLKKTFINILLLILTVAVIASIGMWYRRKTESGTVLMQAKAVELAVRSVSMQYYGTAQKFADQTSVCGLTPKARSDIKELSQADGEYYLLRWDKENFRVEMSAYVENGYMVIYQLDSTGAPGWKLYRTKLM